jgi:hypothetical protein
MAGSQVELLMLLATFTGAGTLALTEKVLEPKNLQVNLDLCKSTLIRFLGSITNESRSRRTTSCIF